MASTEDFDIHAQLQYYKDELRRLWGSRFSFEEIRGSSLSILEAKNKAWNIAATLTPILIRGERGTGKRLFAHAIHLDSPHQEGPISFINCRTEASARIEQLFGDLIEKSLSFRETKAQNDFSLQGTIVLLNIEYITLEIQNLIAKQLERFEASQKETTLLPRFIAILNDTREESDLSLCRDSPLIEWLFPTEIYLAPLQTRLEDIPAICHRFIMELNETTGTTLLGISEEATNLMMQYTWPGNVAELKAIVDRAGLDAQSGIIDTENLFMLQHSIQDVQKLPTLKQVAMRAEKDLILKALIQSKGNKKLASEQLGITRTSFYNKLRELDIEL